MVPPVRRAYSQLKMKVRALPTCRKPVGEGANRTRGADPDKLLFLRELEGSAMKNSCYGLLKTGVKRLRE